MKKKVIKLNEQDIENLVKKIMAEGRYDFDWDAVTGGGDKYSELERDFSACIEPLIEKYKYDFGNDSYGVIDAMFQIMEGMFQKR
jgi:hypothetical protein